MQTVVISGTLAQLRKLSRALDIEITYIDTRMCSSIPVIAVQSAMQIDGGPINADAQSRGVVQFRVNGVSRGLSLKDFVNALKGIKVG